MTTETDIGGLAERATNWPAGMAGYGPNPTARLVRELASALTSLQSRLSKAEGEREALRELVPEPLNTWGAKGYEIDYCREGPGAVPRWCLGLNGVGHIPIAWFYRKADAQRVVDAQAALQSAQSEAAALRVERDELAEESRELSKALTGLTCGGSEFFIRRGERYVADIRACIEWVQRRDTNAHKRFVDAMLAHKASEAREAALRERFAKPIGMQDVRLVAGEGKLGDSVVLQAVNVIIAQRAQLLKDNPNG